MASSAIQLPALIDYTAFCSPGHWSELLESQGGLSPFKKQNNSTFLKAKVSVGNHAERMFFLKKADPRTVLCNRGPWGRRLLPAVKDSTICPVFLGNHFRRPQPCVVLHLPLLSYPPHLSCSLRWPGKSQLCFSDSAFKLLVLWCVETK